MASVAASSGYVLVCTSQASSGLVKAGGIVVLAFAALGAYLFYGTESLATGGGAVPLGKAAAARPAGRP